MGRLAVTLLTALSLGLVALPRTALAQAPAAPAATYSVFLPITFQAAGAQAAAESGTTFDAFKASVADGSAAITGVYVEGVLAQPVVQQPADDPAYVLAEADALTQFSLAGQMGVTGLLAHNYLAGSLYSQLAPGQVVRVVYGTGEVRDYQVNEIRQYQALEPANPYTDFIDLDTGQRQSSTGVFFAVYGGRHHVTFQTCIEKDGNWSWGRLFVLADPLP